MLAAHSERRAQCGTNLKMLRSCRDQVIDLMNDVNVVRPIVPVVLCGGSGTRLWPLSSPERPKQLLPLVEDRTLLEGTLRRLEVLRGVIGEPIVVCNSRYESTVFAQLRAAGVSGGAVVSEPVGRNSAPAVTVAALLARAAARGSDPLLLVLPADHVIANVAAFAAAVDAARVPAEQGYLVTFGVEPTAPATGYGYIRRGDEQGSWATISEFVEKPDAATAQSYVSSGSYLWNSGMFLFSVDAWLRELARYAPELLAGSELATARIASNGGILSLDASFAACPAESIDYAVMEHTDRAAVVPLAAAGWSDVGSWSAVHDVLPKDASGNVAVGDAMLDGCRNTYVAAHGKLVVAVGVEDLVIVETDDAVLVLARDKAESVKQIAELVARRRAKL